MNTLLLSLMLMSPGQNCTNGVCRPPTPITTEWKDVKDGESIALYRGGVQIGVYSTKRKLYWYYSPASRTYSQPCQSPVALPVQEVAPCTDWRTCGVDNSKVAQKKTYSRESGEVDERSAFQAMKESFPDDSHRLYLTFIGEEAKEQLVEFKTRFPEVASTVHCKAYKLSDPMVKDCGFQNGVTLQKGSKVIGRGDYPGAEALAQAVRKKQADYDPAKDPPLVSSPLNDIWSTLEAFAKEHGGIAALIVMALVFLFKKKEVKPANV